MRRCLCPCLPGCRLHPAGAGGRGRAHRAPPVAVPARPAHPGLAQLPPAAGAAARPAPPHRARRHSRKQRAAAPPGLFYFTQGKVIWETCYKLCTSLRLTWCRERSTDVVFCFKTKASCNQILLHWSAS